MAAPHLADNEAVQLTADDAAVSKLSAVKTRYYEDPFIELFVKKGANRAPLINKAAGAAGCQIVSLGAGIDTTWFWLNSQHKAPTRYIELDMPPVVARKVGIIRRAATLHGSLTDVQFTPAAELLSKQYSVLCADLRNTDQVAAALTKAGLDTSLPTLLLSECVLVYLDVEYGDKLIQWAATTLPRSVFVTYEQIRPNDAFGAVMLRNLQARGAPLKALIGFPNPEDQVARYKRLGYTAASCLDMNDIYYRVLPRTDTARADRLEVFDELEEWHLMHAHYCFVVSVNEVHAAPATTDSKSDDAEAHKNHSLLSCLLVAGAPAPAPTLVKFGVPDGSNGRSSSPLPPRATTPPPAAD